MKSSTLSGKKTLQCNSQLHMLFYLFDFGVPGTDWQEHS
jgi:hypothetical protein